MNILGLQFGHDAGAAVLRDGRVASFVLRERLSRTKHALSLDVATIERALADAGLGESDIDYCAITSTQKAELIGRDPGFAEQALATIETASRRAAAGTRRGDRGWRRQAAAGRGRVQPGRLPGEHFAWMCREGPGHHPA